MLIWKNATVVASVREAEGRQELLVRLDGEEEPAPAIHYTDVFPPLKPGERVVVNTTAVELGLGSGGYHFVHHPLDIQGKEMHGPQAGPGHIMKLRYTPWQRSVLAVEEPASPHHPMFASWKNLHGLPVLIGELHSMLPVLVCWLRRCREKTGGRKPNVVYIMTDGGALPLAFSRHVEVLSRLQWIDGTITYGHAYGGAAEAVNKFTALIAGKHVFHADIAIAAMGPGIVGTGTLLGYSGIECGELINAVGILGGLPVYVPRLSGAEERERHYGFSHHALTTLAKISLKRAVIPLPANLPEKIKVQITGEFRRFGVDERHDIRWVPLPEDEELNRALLSYPIPVETMGRTFRDDPLFFRGICAAAQWVWETWQCQNQNNKGNEHGHVIE